MAITIDLKPKITMMNSLPINEFMEDIATSLAITYTVSHGVYNLVITKYKGEENICRANFDGGMGSVLYDYLFNMAIEFRITVSDVHPLNFL